MLTIVVKPRLPKEEVEKLARMLLQTGIDTGDDDILDKAISIARAEGIGVVFRCGVVTMSPAMAYRMRDRGLDIRPNGVNVSGQNATENS